MKDATTILIVDDEEMARASLSDILEEEGFKSCTCESGTEALNSLVGNRTHPPIEVVIADLRMPDMSGLQLLWALRKINPELPVILVTGHASLDTAIEALNQGAFAYHEKPVDIDALINDVRHALHQRQLSTENKDLLRQLQQSNKELKTSNRKIQATARELRQSETQCRTIVEKGTFGYLVRHLQQSNTDLQTSNKKL